MADVPQNPPRLIFLYMFEEVIRWDQPTARGATRLLGGLDVLAVKNPLISFGATADQKSSSISWGFLGPFTTVMPLG